MKEFNQLVEHCYFIFSIDKSSSTRGNVQAEDDDAEQRQSQCEGFCFAFLKDDL